MSTLKYFTLFFFISYNLLALGEEDHKIKIALDYQVEYQTEFNKDIITIKYFIEDYINSNTYEKQKKYYQYNEDDLITYQYDSLPKALKKYYPTYRPTITAIQNLNNERHLIKISLIGGKDEFHSILSSYDLVLKDDYFDCYKIMNTAEYKLRSKNCIVKNNITVYTNKKTISNLEFEKYQNFELKLANFFDLELIHHNVAVFQDTKELYRFLGYDYNDAMYLNNSYGGMFIPWDNLILSANNSAYYPHEIVHLYLNKLDLDTHEIVNEGFATFLGGSLGHDYSYHVDNLKNYVDLKKINLTDFFMNSEKYTILVSKNSSFQYSFGAFLCHLSFQNNEKEGIIKLLNSGKSNNELRTTLLQLFNVEENNLEVFLQKQLSKFNTELCINLI